MKGIFSRVVALTLAVMMVVSLMSGLTFTVGAVTAIGDTPLTYFDNEEFTEVKSGFPKLPGSMPGSGMPAAADFLDPNTKAYAFGGRDEGDAAVMMKFNQDDAGSGITKNYEWSVAPFSIDQNNAKGNFTAGTNVLTFVDLATSDVQNNDIQRDLQIGVFSVTQNKTVWPGLVELAADGNMKFSGSSSSNFAYEPNRWYRFAFELYGGTAAYSVWIEGEQGWEQIVDHAYYTGTTNAETGENSEETSGLRCIRSHLKAKQAGAYGDLYTDNFAIYVNQEFSTELANAVSDAADLSFADFKGANESADSITRALDFGITGKKGSAISFASSNPAVIAEDGTVTPAEEETEVTLTATVGSGANANTKTFQVTVPARVEPAGVLLTDDFGEDRTDAITAKMESTLLESAEKLTLHNLISKDLINTPNKVLCQVLAGTNTADENITFGYKLDQAVGDVRITMTGQLAMNGTGPGNGITAVQLSSDGQNWTGDLKVGSGLYLSKDEATMYLDPDYDAVKLTEQGLSGSKTYTNSKAEAWAEYTLSLSADGKAAVEKLGGDIKYVRVKFIKGGKLWKGAIRKIDILPMPELPGCAWDSSAKITVSDKTQTGAKLTWDAAGEDVTYRVTLTAGDNTVVKTAAEPELVLDSLTADTEYSVSIDAVHSTGWTISTTPLTGTFKTEADETDPDPEPEPEPDPEPVGRVLLLQDTFDENRTEALDANVYAPFTVGGPLKLWDVTSKGSETKPSYKIGQAMRGSTDAFSGTFKFGYEMAEPITDFEVTAWCGMNSNGRDDNFTGTFILSTDADGANAVTLNKGTDYQTEIVEEFDDFKGDGAMLEVEITLTDAGKEKLASTEGLKYWKYETTRARTWAGIFREVRLYGTQQTEVFEHKQFVDQDWQAYLDLNLSTNLQLVNPVVMIPSAGEEYPTIEWMFRKGYNDLAAVDFVYSVDAINQADDKTYKAFMDYNVWIAINGGDLNTVSLSYSTDGQTFVPLTGNTDYSMDALDPQPKDTYPDFSGDKNYTIYELKALKNLPEGAKYFKIAIPELAKRFHITYVSSAFTMAVDSSAPQYQWPVDAAVSQSGVTKTEATISWPSISDQVSDYKVTRTGGTGGNDVQTVSGTQLSYTNLEPGTTYTVTVEALEEGKAVSEKLEGSFTTVEQQIYDWPQGAAVSVGDLTRNSVKLSWNAIPDVTGLTYHVKVVGGSGTVEQDTAEAALELDGLLPNTNYNVEITAVQDGLTASKAPLTGSFTTLAAAAGEAYAMVDTFDNADDLLSDMVDYGWGDVYNLSSGQELNGGKPLNAQDATIFAQQTVNIGTLAEPENIKVLARKNDKQYNKAMYVVYPAENLTSFVAEITLGMYKDQIPGADGITFWVTDGEDPYDYQSFTQLNAVAVQKSEPTEEGTARVNTYLSNSIPEGTKYLRIELRNPSSADSAAMNQIGLKKLKMNFNAETYRIGEITETQRTDNSVSVSWEPENNQDLTYYFLQDYAVVKTITDPTDHSYTATGLTPGVEYRFSLVVMNQRSDSEADLSANFVEHSAVMEEEREWFVDRIKFGDNALHKMDQTVMAEESEKANNSNLFRHDFGSSSIYRKNTSQDGIVVYHVPDMTEFTVDFSLSKMRAENVPVFPTFYVAGADKNFQEVAVAPTSFTIPSDTYATWMESVNSAPNAIPEGTEYLKIVFGKSRVDCEKLQQVKIRRKASWDYQWTGGETAAPEVQSLTDTTAVITWPEVADPKPAEYRFDIYRNGMKVDTVASNIHTYTFSELEPGARYGFGVQAVNTADEKKTTSRIEVSSSTYAQENLWGDGMVAFKDYGATSVTLILPEVAGAAVQKYIIRDQQGNVVGEATQGNEYTVTGLTAGASVTYTVQAVVEQDGIIRYTTLLPARIELNPDLQGWPAGAKIIMNDLNQNGVTLSWTAFGNMDGRKYRITVTDPTETSTSVTTEATSYTLTGLQSGMAYDLALAVVDNAGKKVSYDLAVRFNTLRVTSFFTSFRAADLTYADTEEWQKCNFYTAAEQIPNVVATNKVKFERKYTEGDPLGPVWSGFYRPDTSNAVDAYIVYDKGETLSEIVVRTQHNDQNRGAVEANRPRIEYAMDDGKPQSAQGSFNPNDYTWTEVDYKYATMELIGTTGEYYNGKRKTDNEILETTVTNLPAGARYFRVYVPTVSYVNKNGWRQWIVGVGGKLYDEVTAALQNYDFSRSLTGGDTMDRVSHDVKLPTNIGGYPVTWVSNDETLIGADGKHHTENITPGYYGGQVTFTASIYRYLGDKEPTFIKDYTVEVYKNTDGWSGEDFINYDLAQFTDVNQFTAPQPASALAMSVDNPLPTGVEGGSSFSWSIKEETEYARVEDGKLLITQKLGEDVPLTLVLTATRDGATKDFEYPINIIQSYGTPISDGKIEISSGSGKDNVRKLGFGEAWTSAENDTNPYIQYNLGGSYSFMTVVLGEVGDNVTSYRLMTSEDGEKWTTIHSGQTLGNAKQIAIPLSQQKPKYFRAEFTPKTGSTVKIAEFLLFETAFSDGQIIESTFNLVNLPRSTSTDLVLVTEGINGAAISWKSSDPSVISDTGKVTRGTETKTVTLTATVTYNGKSESRDYTVTVLKKSTAGGGGASGGGSSSGGGNGIGGGLPYVPGNNNPVQPNEEGKPAGLYKDVADSHWAYGYIKTLTDQKVVSGSGDGYFYPENSITREEFLKMILAAANIEVSSEPVAFRDVDANAWYAPYVSTAYRLGIVKGMDETRFGIGEKIQRQDMAVMADRMLRLMEVEAEGAALGYNDKAEIADYAVASVENLAALQIMNGDENQNFLPRISATRAESAKIVCVMSELAK